jgi:hypothetical protein
MTVREVAHINSNLNPIEDADLRRMCPAAFAEAPRSDVSARYGFVNTYELVKAMRENGFVPTQVNSYMRRSEDIRKFTKHMIRFRKEGAIKKIQVGDVVPQIIMVNSHDRSSNFHLFGGIWRLICSNGMMVSESGRVRPLVIRHTTSAVDGLLDATGQLIKAQKFVFEHIDEMRRTMLTTAQQAEFAATALALRPERAGAIDPMQLLNIRRPDDTGDDVWHVYNRVQENLTRGGLKGVTANNRAIVTRGITAVNGDIAINAGLWHLAFDAIERARKSSAASVRKTASKKPSPAKA